MASGSKVASVQQVVSFWLSLMTIVGLPVWSAYVHFFGFKTPTHWWMAAIPSGLALTYLGVQNILLVGSALRSTEGQNMGIADIGVSLAAVAVSGLLVALWQFNVIRLDAFNALLIISFTFANLVEAISTLYVWYIVGRRPGALSVNG